MTDPLSVQRADALALLVACREAAEGDSNDAEIEAALELSEFVASLFGIAAEDIEAGRRTGRTGRADHASAVRTGQRGSRVVNTITVTLDWDTEKDPATAHWVLTEVQAQLLEAWLNVHVGPADGVS